MTIREDALAGTKTALFEACAKNESMAVEDLMAGVAAGTIAIPKNVHHDFDRIMAIGAGTSTKVNANIGSSKDISSLDEELEKLRVAVEAGTEELADSVSHHGCHLKDLTLVVGRSGGNHCVDS